MPGSVHHFGEAGRRYVLDLVGFKGCLKLGGGGVKRGRRVGYLDRGGGIADCQSQILREGVVQLDFEILGAGDGEPGRRGAQGVGTDRKVR